jgi:hypothetical protein
VECGAAKHRSTARTLRPRRWILTELADLMQRRFRMRRSAVELLFINGRTVYLDFHMTAGGAGTEGGDGGGGDSPPPPEGGGRKCAEDNLGAFVRAVSGPYQLLL